MANVLKTSKNSFLCPVYAKVQWEAVYIYSGMLLVITHAEVNILNLILTALYFSGILPVNAHLIYIY